MKRVLWLRRLFYCLILCLLTCNLIYLTLDYVKYETDTNVAPYFPVRLNVTKLSLCFSINSLLDSSPHGYSFTGDQRIKYINWTFNEVFKRMPSASSTLDSCKYRDFDLDILREEKDGRKCAQLFKVFRYRMQGYMCYLFTFPLDQEYSYHVLANSLFSSRELYHLSIAKPLSDQHIFYPLLHLDDYPDDDQIFNGEAYKESGSLFQLSYDLCESHSLPSPYETHCAPVSKITCYQRCLTDAQRKVGYAPDSYLNVDNSSASSLRLMPLKGGIHLHHYRSSCYDKCPYEACSQVLVNTRFNRIDSKNEKLLFVIETVNRPITKIQYLPKFLLIDYITQVGSVVSIWTGISVITLSKLIHTRRNVPLKTLHSVLKSHFKAVRVVLSTQQEARLGNDELSVQKTKLRAKLRKIFFMSNLFKVLLLPFFVWQLWNVIHHYFLFQTTAKFNYDLNPRIAIPTLGFCSDYEDKFKVRSINLNENNYHQLFLAHDQKYNRTLRQLFDETTDDVIEGCFIRHWKSRFKWFRYNNGSSCLRYVAVKKLFSRKKLCYQILPTEKLEGTYYHSDMKLLLTNPGIVYSIVLRSQVVVSRKLKIFTQFGNELPLISAEFSALVYKSDMRKMISFSNRLYQVKMLPAPYDTFCDPVLGRAQCLEDCIFQVLRRYNRISYGTTEDRKLDMQYLSYSDLLNDSVNGMLRQAELFCDQKCWRSSCDYSFTSTEIEDEILVERVKNIFAVDLPSYPTIEMKTVPVMTLYDFVYEICCCFSFWLGVSFIDFRPTPKAMKRRMKMKVHLTQMYWVVERVTKELLKSYHQLSFSLIVQKLSKRKLVNFFFCSFTMTFCFCHIIHSMMIYMSYSSLINVYEELEKRTDMSLFICFDMAKLIARKFPTGIEDPLVARSVILNRTVASLFVDTPREDELIRECGHWGLYSRRVNLSGKSHVSDRIFFLTKNITVCDQVYEVNKIVIQSYICYSIWPRYYAEWNQFQMKHALNEHKTLLKVSVNSSLLTKKFTLMVAWERFYPFISSTFAPNILRDVRHNRYDVSYIRYIQSILPSPKSNDGFVPFMFDRCLSQCVNK